MAKMPRGLTADEQEAWERVAATVKPLARVKKSFATTNIKAAASSISAPVLPQSPLPITRLAKAPSAGRIPQPLIRPPTRPPLRPVGQGGLDSHWDKRLKTGSIDPDFSLDLHGHGLDAAHDRLETGIAQARAMGARLVLVVTGKPRPVDAADRATQRGAIRAKVLDWLAAGPHADSIAAIRKSHRRHGGDGAIYIVLRRGI